MGEQVESGREAPQADCSGGVVARSSIKPHLETT